MTAFRFTTAGESHGPGLVAIVEGLPAGLELDRERIDREMARRQLGHGRGGRMKIESDSVEVRSGIRHGRTLGSPIALLVANRDYANWEERMNPWPVDAEVEESHLPRPGHADLVGSQKYGHRDVRNVLERASARETAARVAAGAVAKEFLHALGVGVLSHVLRIASVAAAERPELGAGGLRRGRRLAGALPRPRGRARRWSRRSTACARRTRASAGMFEVRAFGLVPGLGSHVAWDERLDGRLAQRGGLDPGGQGRLGGGGLGGRGLARLGVPRRDLLVGRARLPPRDQPRRRRRGRDVERRAARGPRRAEADLDPDQAAALGRHRDQGAGAGDARAHRLDRGPGRRGRRRGDGRAGARALLPGEVRRRPHRRRSRRRAGVPGADRVAAARRQRSRRSSFIGFMGAGKSRAAPGRSRGRARGARQPTSCSRPSSGCAIDEFFARRRRGGVSASRGARFGSALLDRAGGEVVALGGGSVLSETRARCASPPRRRLARGRRRGRLAAGRGPAARSRATARGSRRCSPSGAAYYESLADAIVPRHATTRPRARSTRCSALRELPAGTRMAWAESASGEYPVYVGRGLLDAGFWPLDGGRFLVTDTAVGGLYADSRRVDRRLGRGRPRRADQDAGRGRARPARAGDARRDPLRPRRRARRRRRRRPRRLLRGGLPARDRRRPGADDAGRPGRLGARRQDRGRPARGQELRRRLPPAGGGAHRPRDPADAAARRARGGLRRGGEDGTDRGRLALGAGPIARAARPRPARRARLRMRAGQARGGRRRRARRRRAARRSTSATRSVTRSRRRPVIGTTATGRRSGSACSRRSSSPAPAICATRSRRSSRATGCRRDSTGRSTSTRCSRPSAATRSAPRGASGSSSARSPGELETGRTLDPDRVRAAVEKLRG